MHRSHLRLAVERFAAGTRSLPEAALNHPWTWHDYNEGVRLAFFRVYEELRQLAAGLESARSIVGPPMTPAHRALAAHHEAFWDLQAILLGVDDSLAQRPPSEGEWSLLETARHSVRTERSFYAVVRYGVDRARSGDGRPAEMPDEAWEAFWATDGFTQVNERDSLRELLAYYRDLHQRVLVDLADITTEEMNLPCTFWESKPMPVRFRLHRFDSHLRQHTVQAQKVLDRLRGSNSEAHRLLRLIYNALARVEGTLIGAPDIGQDDRQATAKALAVWTEEIASAEAG